MMEGRQNGRLANVPRPSIGDHVPSNERPDSSKSVVFDRFIAHTVLHIFLSCFFPTSGKQFHPKPVLAAMTLTGLLHETLDSDTKRQLLLLLWPSPIVLPKNIDWEPFFTYYTKQCQHALHDQGKHILARTHQHILDMSRDLEQPCDRETAESHIQPLFTSPNHPRQEEILDNTIDLAARIYTMVNIGGGKFAIFGQCQLEWENGNLKDFLSDYFDQKPEQDKNNLKLERAFKACKLHKIAGINIQWTDNLADHLRLVDDEDKTVAIFHHASFLKFQNRYTTLL
jgi:hypothetical protein